MRKIVLLIIVSFIAIALLVTVIVLYAGKTAHVRLEQLLEQVDASFANGYFFKTEELLQEAMRLPVSEEKSLSILKRAHRLSVARSDYSLLVKLSTQARAKFRNSKRIAYVGAFASLRTGRTADAIAIGSMPEFRDQCEGILYEALLGRDGALDAGLIARTGPDFPEIALLSNDDPVLFSRIASELNDLRLELDAALMYAGRGELDKAAGSLDRISSMMFGTNDSRIDSIDERTWTRSKPFFFPVLFLSYDAGRFDRVLALCDRALAADPRNPDIRLLAADVRMDRLEYERAASEYAAVIETDPRYSALPYLNLSRIVSNDRTRERALEYLKRAHSYFPESSDVSFELARSYSAIGADDDAVALLSGIVKNHPDDANARVALLDIEKKSLTVEGYRLRLWELFNHDRGNVLYAALLLSHLILFEDMENADRVISIIEADERARSQDRMRALVAHNRGILNALSGDIESALRHFDESILASDNPTYRFNRAVCYVESKMFDRAETELWRLLKPATQDAHARTFLSRVEALLARSKFESGNAGDAALHARRAIEHDPGNLAAGRLLTEIGRMPVRQAAED